MEEEVVESVVARLFKALNKDARSKLHEIVHLTSLIMVTGRKKYKNHYKETVKKIIDEL